MFLNCQTITDYEKYLRQYPKGKFAYKAKRAIQQIESGNDGESSDTGNTRQKKHQSKFRAITTNFNR